MKTRFRRQFQPEYTGTKGEKNTGESMTQPDMSLTARQLLVNHTRGLSSESELYREGHYFGETEIPKFQDLTEMYEYREQLNAQAEALKRKIDEETRKSQEELEALEASKKVADKVTPRPDQDKPAKQAGDPSPTPSKKD